MGSRRRFRSGTDRAGADRTGPVHGVGLVQPRRASPRGRRRRRHDVDLGHR
nr:hypothetical protein [Prescottella equi]